MSPNEAEAALILARTPTRTESQADADELLRWIADVYKQNKDKGFSETKCRSRTLSRNLLIAVHKYLGRQLPTGPSSIPTISESALWKE